MEDSIMPAYVIVQLTINDPEEYAKYSAGVMEILAQYNGRVLAASDRVEVIEGSWPYSRTVILEFPSLEQARSSYRSSAYQSLAQHRFKASRANVILIDGKPPR